jgi:hypothetical protein
MQHDNSPGAPRREARRSRLRRAALVAVVLSSVALLAAACSGGSGSPGAGGSPGASPGNPTTGDLAYSQCMRAHGITNFPDPNSSGGISISGNSGINASSSQYQAASKACQSKLGGQQSQAQQDEDYAASLKYAHCMQSRGQDIPDPAAPGSSSGADTQSHSGSSGTSGGNGVNPNSPQYIAANKACEHYLPTGQRPSLGGSGGGS